MNSFYQKVQVQYFEPQIIDKKWFDTSVFLESTEQIISIEPVPPFQILLLKVSCNRRRVFKKLERGNRKRRLFFPCVFREGRIDRKKGNTKIAWISTSFYCIYCPLRRFTVIKKLPLFNACVDLVQKLNQSNQKPKMVLPYVLFSTLPPMHQISNFV